MMEKNFQVLKDSASLNKLLDYLEDCEHDFVSFDIETDSNIEATARVVGIGVTCWIDEGYYVPLASFDKQKNELIPIFDEVFERGFVNELCAILAKKKLIMHNGVFDINVMFNQYGVDLTDALHADTILMKHTIHEERPFGLKDLAIKFQKELGLPENEAANQEQLDLKASVLANGGKWTKDQKDIFKGDLELIGKYCCADVDLTLRLFDYLEGLLENEGSLKFFYDEEVMPLYKKATIPMKRKGVFIDVDYFERLEKELEHDIMELTNRIFDQIEDDIQPLVQKILDDQVDETRTGKFAQGVLQHYELPVPLHKKTGKPTLAKSALQSLKTAYPDHVAIDWLLHTPKLIEVEQDRETEESVNVNGEVFTRVITKRVKAMVPDPEDTGPKLPSKAVYAIKKKIYVDANPTKARVFNLSSNKHLAWLLFEKYGCEPKSYSRETDAPSVDKDSLAEYTEVPFVRSLIKLKKLQKALNTYVKPIVNKHINGWIYPPMKQFGTTSGRYSCGSDSETTDKVSKDINLQTLPRFDYPEDCYKCSSRNIKVINSGLSRWVIDCQDCKEQDIVMNLSMVKKGFIAPPGYKVVNADFSSVEPRLFSWVSGDKGLKQIWLDGLDFYSKIAIDVFNLREVSARETDKHYLKKKSPKMRQKSKTFALAVPYGANEWRIAKINDIHPTEARDWIDSYLAAYPGLEEYMNNQDLQARRFGYIKTQFGRIRHVPDAPIIFKQFGPNILNKRKMSQMYGDFGEEQYYKFRNIMNNAKNFPIQATAAHVCNAALIELADQFKKHKIDGWIALQIHDEITCIVKENQADLASRLLKESMEKNRITRQIDIPILAEPVIGNNFSEIK